MLILQKTSNFSIRILQIAQVERMILQKAPMDGAEAMLRRKISEALLEWKRTKTNQGLLVTGAR